MANKRMKQNASRRKTSQATSAAAVQVRLHRKAISFAGSIVQDAAVGQIVQSGTVDVSGVIRQAYAVGLAWAVLEEEGAQALRRGESALSPVDRMTGRPVGEEAH